MSTHVEQIANLRNLLDSLITESVILNESSPLYDTFGGDKVGLALAQRLHSKYKVSDKAKLHPYSSDSGNLNLKTIKSHYYNFIVFTGPDGWAAFKPSEGGLKDKLNRPGYNPREDKSLTYTVVYAQEVEDPLNPGKTKIKVDEFVTSRGGRFNRPEKKGVATKTAADFIKEIVGKPVKVFNLLHMPDAAEKNMSPEELLIHDPEAARGTSVPAGKIAARQELKSLNAFADQVASQTESMANKVLVTVLRQLENAPVPSELHIEALSDVLADPQKTAEKWSDAVRIAMKDAQIKSGVSEEDFMSDFQDDGTEARLELFKNIISYFGNSTNIAKLLKPK